MSRGSVMQVHFKWSIKSSQDTVLLRSLRNMFKKSETKSPSGVPATLLFTTADVYVIKNVPGATLL